MKEVVLEVHDLVKTFILDGSPLNAVDHVSFQVHSGEFVGLVGPSGSGKTTLLSMLAALLLPSSGDILIDGHQLSAMKDAERVKLRRSRIGFTFQANNLIPYLTAQENVEFMLRLNGTLGKINRLRAEELLARLGLEDRLRSLPAQMSGGQQQRVAIARALVNDPAILLADEPTGNLDSKAGEEIMSIFHRLNREEGLTIVLVTHDPAVGANAQRVIHVRDGQIEQPASQRTLVA